MFYILLLNCQLCGLISKNFYLTRKFVNGDLYIDACLSLIVCIYSHSFYVLHGYAAAMCRPCIGYVCN